ncbi:MAG TPA: hypothetical protein VMU57_21390 [Edaphobacter sp.]|uniref:hypothetical protein n=1 Tax=Edaphobacter sp. TaxID=1934404 RepID=UPI002CBF9139|nr:hypothetical protein [Edaphobacter sp.]HUZ97468.1 hypothetical protein [Edaphobacter sp.]
MGGMKLHICVTALIFPICASLASCQNMDVKIIQRQSAETTYNYVVAGYSSSTSNGSVNCNAYGNTANCSGSSTTQGYTAPAREVSFNVIGATYSLLLPDGRVVIVNCVSKFQERMAGAAGNHRSCRMPLVDEIQADFKGKKAKLSWVVSLDGKKRESETYSILAVLPKK